MNKNKMFPKRTSHTTSRQGTDPEQPDIFTQANDLALRNMDNFVDWLGLETQHQGKEIQFLNPKREDDNFGSASINSETGIWADFAEGDAAKGADCVSFVAYLRDLSQMEAANLIIEDFTGSTPPTTPTAQQAPKDEGTRLHPIPANAPPVPESFYKMGSPSMTFTYKNTEGNTLGHILRFDLPSGEKTIRPLTLWDVNGTIQWKMKGFPVPHPLYNLDQLAARPDDPVLVVEGEKSADAARGLFPNYVVTTAMHGAKSVDKADLSPLLGREVLIWPDNDEAGHGYASKIGQTLLEQDSVANVRVLKQLAYLPELGEDVQLKPQTEALPQGFDAADAVQMGWTAELLAFIPPDELSEVVTSEKDQLNEYRSGNFVINDTGVFAIKQKNGDEVLVRICSRLDIVALSRDSNNANWGLLTKFKDHDGHLHEKAIPKELLSGTGEAYRQVLLNSGLDIDMKQKDSLTMYFMEAQPESRVLCVNTIGWHNNVFVLPSKTFGQNDQRVILQTPDIDRTSSFGIRGELAEWQQFIGMKCIGNSRLILAVCIALTGPFLKVLSVENGGFHFRGQSSSGKTKALSVAASIWGGKGMVRSWRTTGNAIESLAVEHNDTVLCLDELGQVLPSEAGDIAYTLGNGQSKSRANRFGHAKPTGKWRLLFISTGEIGLGDHMAANGGQVRAGQEIRLLDIPSDASSGMGIFENIHQADTAQQFADSLQTMVETYHGTVGAALLDLITQPYELDRAAYFIDESATSFVSSYVPNNAHGQICRAAMRFGVVAGVGEYCIEKGLLPWHAGDATHAVSLCFSAWLETRGGNVAAEEVRALAQVREYIERNGESRFTLMQQGIEDNTGDRTINRTGFRKVLDNGAIEYWVLPEMYLSELCSGLDSTLVTNVLKKYGYLELDTAGKSTVVKRPPGMGPKRVYVIKPELLQSEEEMAQAA
ncbi:DUF927 domain-containing protein [Ferrovum myxofaciens]|uniref:DUF927 domain-containing protein n=2 Tax=root TaxID=1 RepID=A0A9E6MZW3_9PROT|nr:DUF927 domain-containing protein [Ferrovum myxofaciens]QKE38160.1 MAG: DUF927 domain-containing protein [Ferrovum myxofaciens]QWY75886.1 MAG: DUF927 domain-containing protein [Ferrovum myxofaciens]QWY78618.1 MAG: DUF927 domain-containing protein [Ferrovum myxofaciens]